MANEEATRAQAEQDQPQASVGEEQSGQDNATEEQPPESEVAQEPAEGAEAEVSVETLLAEIETLQATVNGQKESVLRAQAEMQNVRRRAERDVESAHKFALEKFSSDLLPVIDSLERALEAAENIDGEAAKAMKDGVELTLKMFVDTLHKHGVEQLNPMGEPFNPEFHQAMSMVPNADMEPNSVMAVMQKGYRLQGRLVRPAMVVVSKAP